MAKILETYKRKFEVQDRTAIDTAVLESVPLVQSQVVQVETLLSSEEFTSSCPLSGLPDFGVLKIKYLPDKKLVEMKSLKLYITSFRNVGIFMEEATQRICEDLGNLLTPISLEVSIDFKARGGYTNQVSAVWTR